MSTDEILLEAELAMEKSVDYMVHEFASVRTGKASPALVENVDVVAYGSSMKLKQLALITTPEPRLLVVQPFDASTVRDVEKALKESKIGITPLVDGKIIRLPVPELSEERRKDLRQVAQADGGRSPCARSRQSTDCDGRGEEERKAGETTEDQLHDTEAEIQKLTDRFVKSVDEHFERKEAEVMKVLERPNRSLLFVFCHPEPAKARRRSSQASLGFRLRRKTARTAISLGGRQRPS